MSMLQVIKVKMSPASSASWDSGNESAARLKMNNSHAERGAGFLLEPCSFSLQPLITNALNHGRLDGVKTSRGAGGEAKVQVILFFSFASQIFLRSAQLVI